MAIKKIRRCPRCNETYTYEPAFSSRDNRTEICPNCYVAEAFEDYLGESYKGEPYWKTEALTESQGLNNSSLKKLEYSDKFQAFIADKDFWEAIQEDIDKIKEQHLTESLLTEAPAASNGVYSLKNGWLKRPEKDNIPDTIDLEPELSEWLRKYDACHTIEEIDDFIDDIYKLRQESLLTDGEYGKGNQVFKELRNRGILQELRNMKVELENQEMSLTEEQIGKKLAEDNRKKCVEFYHHCMESYSLPGEYDRNNPTIDDYTMKRTMQRFGYGRNDIINFLQGKE